MRKSRAGVWLWTWTALRIWLARIPEGPAAEPLLKERNFLSTSDDSLVIGSHPSEEGRSVEIFSEGCFFFLSTSVNFLQLDQQERPR